MIIRDERLGDRGGVLLRGEIRHIEPDPAGFSGLWLSLDTGYSVRLESDEVERIQTALAATKEVEHDH